MSRFYFLFFLVAHISWGQQATTPRAIDSTRLVQLSGVVVSEEDLAQMPYTTVYDKTQRRGVVADYYGFFSFVVYPGDTLLFSSFGYKTSSYVVPDSLKERRYSIIHMLQKDTLNLPEITVYPWPSREDFARAFLEMKPYDDAIRRAQRELSGENLAFVAARLDNDASLSYGNMVNQRYTKLYTNGQLPANNLLNPYSWAKLIQDWKEGRLSRQ
jgi:hypothetical protein